LTDQTNNNTRGEKILENKLRSGGALLPIDEEEEEEENNESGDDMKTYQI
jgi:hypothetical protein